MTRTAFRWLWFLLAALLIVNVGQGAFFTHTLVIAQNEAALSSRLLTYDRASGELSFVEISDETTHTLSQTTIAPNRSLDSWWVNDDAVLIAVGTNDSEAYELYLATTTQIEPLNLDILQPDTVEFVDVVGVRDPYVFFTVTGIYYQNVVMLDTSTGSATYLSGAVLFDTTLSWGPYIRFSADGRYLRYWSDSLEIPYYYTLVERDLKSGDEHITHQIDAEYFSWFTVDDTGDNWIYYRYASTPDETVLILYRADGTSQDLSNLYEEQGARVGLWRDEVLLWSSESDDGQPISYRFEGLDTDFEAVLRFPPTDGYVNIYRQLDNGRFLARNSHGGETWLAQDGFDPISLGHSILLEELVSRDWRWLIILDSVDNPTVTRLWDLEAGRLVHEFDVVSSQTPQFSEAGVIFSDGGGTWYTFNFATEAAYDLPDINGRYHVLLPDGSVTYGQRGATGFDMYRYDPITETHTLLFEGIAVYYPQHIQ